MNYIMSLEPAEVIRLIDLAHEKREEERAWQMWLMKYQHMDKKTFVPFSQFFQQVTMPSKISTRPAEEMLKKAAEIRNKIKAQSSRG